MSDPAVVSAFERSLVRVMRAGMWISSALLSAGLALVLFSGRETEGESLLRAGLVMLMATPVLRVVLSVVEAIRRRDWFWLSATVAVALVLGGTVWYSFRAL